MEKNLGKAMGVPSKRKLEHREQKNWKVGEMNNFLSTRNEKEMKEKLPLRLKAEVEETEKRGEVSSREEDREIDESYGLDEEEETEEEDDEEEGSSSNDSELDGDDIQKGATKFTNGSRAFKMAFTKIMKKSPQDDLVLVSCGFNALIFLSTYFLSFTCSFHLTVLSASGSCSISA